MVMVKIISCNFIRKMKKKIEIPSIDDWIKFNEYKESVEKAEKLFLKYLECIINSHQT